MPIIELQEINVTFIPDYISRILHSRGVNLAKFADYVNRYKFNSDHKRFIASKNMAPSISPEHRSQLDSGLEAVLNTKLSRNDVKDLAIANDICNQAFFDRDRKFVNSICTLFNSYIYSHTDETDRTEFIKAMTDNTIDMNNIKLGVHPVYKMHAFGNSVFIILLKGYFNYFVFRFSDFKDFFISDFLDFIFKNFGEDTVLNSSAFSAVIPYYFRTKIKG